MRAVIMSMTPTADRNARGFVPVARVDRDVHVRRQVPAIPVRSKVGVHIVRVRIIVQLMATLAL